MPRYNESYVPEGTMTESARKILQDALDLPAPDRATLVDALITSLDRPDAGIDELWAEEAEARLRAFKSGEIDAIPAEDVFSR